MSLAVCAALVATYAAFWRTRETALDALARTALVVGGVVVVGGLVAGLFSSFSRESVVATLWFAALVSWVWALRSTPWRASWMPHREEWATFFCAVVVAFAAFGLLVQTRYSYDGLVARSVSIDRVENARYTMPYFSDEWVSVALVRDVIETRTAPTGHPFLDDSDNASYLVAYFTALSAAFLVTGLDPVFDFSVMAIAMGVALSVAAFLLARRLGAARWAALIVGISIPFIANSANLAGVWYLIPMHAGLLVLVATWLFAPRSTGWRIAGYAGTIVVYPPALAVVVPAAIAFESRRVIAVVAATVCAGGLAAITFAAVSPTVSFTAAVAHAANLLVRRLGLEFAGSVPWYAPHIVLPPIILVAAVMGARTLMQRHRGVFAALVVSTIGWIAYSFITTTVIIDPQRIIFIAAYIGCVAAAFGYERAVAFIERELKMRAWHVAVAITVLTYFAALPTYTADERWRSFILPTPNSGAGTFVFPAPPASEYLTLEDLALFSRYDVVASSAPRRFVSTQWKGLVLGSATRHIPLSTKSSIAGTRMVFGEEVMNADCTELDRLRNAFDIDLAYVQRLPSCSFVYPVATSSEGFVLYELRGK